MKCDIHHQKNAHHKTSPTESDGVQQFQFQTLQFFPQYKYEVGNVYELVVCGDRKKHDVNQTKLGLHTVWSQYKRMISLYPPS